MVVAIHPPTGVEPHPEIKIRRLPGTGQGYDKRHLPCCTSFARGRSCPGSDVECRPAGALLARAWGSAARLPLAGDVDQLRSRASRPPRTVTAARCNG